MSACSITIELICIIPVFTYRELMQFILKTTGRKRPILSLPFAVGVLQGTVLEKLPVNLFTVTRAQVQLSIL